MNGKPLTKREIATIRKWYRQKTAAAIAADLGCTTRQVRWVATKFGLCRRQPGYKRSTKIRRLIETLHARGWSDPEITSKAGCSREFVGEIRREMGLASNANNARHRARVAAKTREQCRQAGVPNLAHIRVMAMQKFARQSGWPEDLRPRAVEILDLLYDHGPKTRREIAADLGMRWKGSRASLSSNDPEGSYLAHLMKRGLVICLPRKVRTGGQGKNVSLYMIPPYVVRDESRRKKWEPSRHAKTTTVGHSRRSCRPPVTPSQTSCAGPSRPKSRTSASKQSLKRNSKKRKRAT